MEARYEIEAFMGFEQSYLVGQDDKNYSVPVFYGVFAIFIVPVTNAILNRFHTVVLTAYSMGIPAATLSVILVGVAAFGFKMYSRFFYGFFEVVVGIIFMHRIISSTTPG